MRNNRLRSFGALSIALLFAGCTGDKGTDGSVGPEGPEGAQGAVGAEGTPGTAGQPGTDGGSCTIVDNGSGTKTITCDDGTTVVVTDGTPGTSCTVADNGDGCKTITCEDATSVTVCDGQNGEDGKPLVDPSKNYIAIHDERAPAYDDDCVSCHVGKDAEASLDPTIPGFHALKLASPVIPGATINEKCVYCHPSVDLTPNGSAAWTRRNVDVTTCSACHAGGANKFYAAP